MAVDPLDVLVKSGLLVSGNAISRQDVLIDQGKVVVVGDGLSPEDACKVNVSKARGESRVRRL